MYETIDENGNLAKINYVVWSETFLCPHCSNELIYWDLAIDEKANKFKDSFNCNECGVHLNKKDLRKNLLQYMMTF